MNVLFYLWHSFISIYRPINFIKVSFDLRFAFSKMCQMWLRIRTGVLWDPARKLACAVEAMDLNKVKSIFISMDPFHKDNYALREFWYQISTPNVKKTNPKLVIKTEIRIDGKTPYFMANLEDNRKLVFKTEGMQTSDVIMRLNKLLGNKEIVLPKESQS